MAIQARVACLSLEAIAGFLWSVAFSRGLLQHTRLNWVEYRDSTALNIIYAILPWKAGPGTAEVQQNWEAISQTSQTIFAQSWSSFLKVLPEGAERLGDWLETMDGIRTDCLEAVQEVFADAQKINAEVIGLTNEAIRNLARIKLGATIILAGTTGGLGVAGSGLAMAAGSVNLGYSVTGAVVKNWASLKSAGAIAIDVSKELLKEGAQQVATKGAETVVALGTMRTFLAAGKWDEACEEVARLSKEMARKVSKKKAARAGRKLADAKQTRDLARQEMKSGAKMNAAGGKALRAIPVVFAALDIINAVSEYDEDTKGIP